VARGGAIIEDENKEPEVVQTPMPYGRVVPVPAERRHGFREVLDTDTMIKEAEQREAKSWFPRSRDSYPLYVVLVVGLITIPRVQDRDELVRVMIATAAYGVAVACSLFILQLTARSGFWAPDIETVPRVHRTGRSWLSWGARPGTQTREVQERDRLLGERAQMRRRGAESSGDVSDEVYSSEEDEDMVVEGEEERSRRISEALARAREKNRQVHMMEELKKALEDAQLQATTLQLKLNYYDSELMKEKRERRMEKENLMSRQKLDVARLFSLMIKYSPVTLREALAPSDEARCIVSPRLPFEITHVNNVWSNTFQWDSHEIVGYNLNFFKGPIVDGTSWDQLLDALLVYGYATADIINCGSGGGYFVHVMTITPIVAPMPRDDDLGMEGPSETIISAPAGPGGPGLNVDVRLLAFMVRSTVRKLPDLSAELRSRLDSYVTADTTSNTTYLLGPFKARYPIQLCYRRSLIENLEYMNQTDDALYLVDTKGDIVHTNAVFTDLTLYSFREAEGKSLETLLQADVNFHEQMRMILNQQSTSSSSSKGGQEWACDTILMKKNGERFKALVSLVALGAPDKLVIGKIESYERIPSPSRRAQEDQPLS